LCIINKYIIESIAELEEAIKTMTEMTGIRKILSVLGKYVQEHFSTEEVYMKKIRQFIPQICLVVTH